MTESLQSFAAGTSGLAVAFVISLILAFTRPVRFESQQNSVKSLLFAGILLHAFHVTEETIFGFFEQFPTLIGLPTWPLWLFLSFNVAWLLIWLAGLLFKHPPRMIIATFWFLAIASAINGIAHPVFSVLVGGYFPGLVTSPFVGILGILLARELYRASNGSPTSETAV